MGELISVIMSVHKEPVPAVQCSIESLMAQTYKNWELRIVLDCPDNISMKEYLMSLSARHPNIHIIINETNLGLGASLNKAVACSAGEYCARMDVEDISFPNRFKKQIEFVTRYPHTDLLFTQWEEIHANGSVKVRRPVSKDVKKIQRNFFIKTLLLHPTLFTRKEILKYNPYPEMERPEDWVLFLDLIRNSYKFDILEEVLYRYIVDDTQKFQKVRVYSKNLLPHLAKNIRYYWKNLYFWVYYLRIFLEYAISRNSFIYQVTSKILTSVHKRLFKSV